MAREVDSGTGTKLTVPVRSYDYDSRGQRLGQQAGSSETKGTYRPFTYDAGGSVIGLEDSSGLYGTGNADQYHFDPYGNGTIGGLGSTTDAVAGSNASYNPFRFQGFYADSDVSTYDMVARAYRPDVQQFLSQDRFQSATGDLELQQNPLTSSRYAFAYANRVDNIESDGHEPYHGSFDDCYKGSHFCAPRKKPTRKQQVRAQQVRTVERQQSHNISRWEAARNSAQAGRDADDAEKYNACGAGKWFQRLACRGGGVLFGFGQAASGTVQAVTHPAATYDAIKSHPRALVAAFGDDVWRGLHGDPVAGGRAIAGLAPVGGVSRLRAARQAYVDAARDITERGRARVVAGEDASRVARESVEARNALKDAAREPLGPFRWFLDQRNRRLYGDPLGPSYEYLRYTRRRSDAQIIESAGRTSRRWNRVLWVR